MYTKISKSSCGSFNEQKGRVGIIAITLLLSTQLCWCMHSDLQRKGTDCHKSYEQFFCASSGLLVGSGVGLCAEIGMIAQDTLLFDARQLGVCGTCPRESFFCGLMLALGSTKYLNEPDHSCVCGYGKKMKRALVDRTMVAPRSLTMTEKKD